MIFNPVYGGASAPNLGTKTITENGIYQASSDHLDGYSEVTANVPNSYSAADEGKVVDNGTLVAQTSRSVTANGTYDTTLNNEVVVNVPGSSPTLITKNITANGTYNASSDNADGYSSVTVNVSGGGGVQVITRADWNALSLAEKQSYGLIAIQDAATGFDRGELVYGADYDPYKTAVHIWTKSTGGNDAAMWVQAGTWDTETDTFTASETAVGVVYNTVQGSNVYDCAGLVDLRYGRTSLNWDVYTKAVVIVDSVEYAVGVVAKLWRYNTSADFYVIAK